MGAVVRLAWHAIQPLVGGGSAGDCDPGGAFGAGRGRSKTAAGHFQACSRLGSYLPIAARAELPGYASELVMAGAASSTAAPARFSADAPLRSPTFAFQPGPAAIHCHAETALEAGPLTALEAAGHGALRPSDCPRPFRLVARPGGRSAKSGSMKFGSDGAPIPTDVPLRQRSHGTPEAEGELRSGGCQRLCRCSN